MTFLALDDKLIETTIRCDMMAFIALHNYIGKICCTTCYTSFWKSIKAAVKKILTKNVSHSKNLKKLLNYPRKQENLQNTSVIVIQSTIRTSILKPRGCANADETRSNSLSGTRARYIRIIWNLWLKMYSDPRNWCFPREIRIWKGSDGQRSDEVLIYIMLIYVIIV